VVYQERNTWAGLIVSVIAIVVYVVVVLQSAGGRPLPEVDWVPIMLWTIGGGIVASILLSIVWGMIAARRDPEGVGASDQRDRDIERASDRVGQAFLVLGGLGAIVLCAFEADWFWIANAVYAGFALSAIVGGIARVTMYRRGLA
jgi:MFS family permease